MTKEDDFTGWAIIGAAGAAVVGLLVSALGQMGPPKFPGSNVNQQVNSYQATSSYVPPSPPKSGGCGCNGQRR